MASLKSDIFITVRAGGESFSIGGVMVAAAIFLAHAADENIKLWGSDPREGGE